MAPRRMVEGMPSSESLRGSQRNEWFVYQYAARASALVFLLVSLRLTPAAGYGNRVMVSEVLARAVEARRRMMGAGSSEKWEVEKYESNGKPRSSTPRWTTSAGCSFLESRSARRVTRPVRCGDVWLALLRMRVVAIPRFRRIVYPGPRSRVVS